MHREPSLNEQIMSEIQLELIAAGVPKDMFDWVERYVDDVVSNRVNVMIADGMQQMQEELAERLQQALRKL